MAGKTFVLPHVLAYAERDSGGSAIHVLLTEKPMDSSKVLASLRQSGEVGISLIGSVQSNVQSEGDRIRGTSKTIAKQDVLGKSFEFQASFDTTILRAAESK